MNLKIPNHVAVIVDGNGRWAKEKGLSRSKGHDAGLDNLMKLSKYIFEKGTKYLSIYVFSTDNFKRDEKEVKHLMDLFVLFFKNQKKFFSKNNIKVVFSGIDNNLPIEVIKAKNKIIKIKVTIITNLIPLFIYSPPPNILSYTGAKIQLFK